MEGDQIRKIQYYASLKSSFSSVKQGTLRFVHNDIYSLRNTRYASRHGSGLSFSYFNPPKDRSATVRTRSRPLPFKSRIYWNH